MDRELPKISIVTPSFNQAAFLEDSIKSVLGQCYPNLEYIVLDGGSTDGSREIIERFADQLTYWSSAPDNGQAAAINTGFDLATGDILAWLNSDDVYLPGTFHHVARRLGVGEPLLHIGNCVHFCEGSCEIRGSDVCGSAAAMNLNLHDYIIQPSSFWNRKAWRSVGKLDESLTYTFDWDWFIRANNSAVPMAFDHRYFSMYRLHNAHKTGTGADRRLDEIASIYTRYAGAHYADAFFEYRSKHKSYFRIRRLLRECGLGRFQGVARNAMFRRSVRTIGHSEFDQVVGMAGGW